MDQSLAVYLPFNSSAELLLSSQRLIFLFSIQLTEILPLLVRFRTAELGEHSACRVAVANPLLDFLPVKVKFQLSHLEHLQQGLFLQVKCCRTVSHLLLCTTSTGYSIPCFVFFISLYISHKCLKRCVSLFLNHPQALSQVLDMQAFAGVET